MIDSVYFFLMFALAATVDSNVQDEWQTIAAVLEPAMTSYVFLGHILDILAFTVYRLLRSIVM